MRQGKIVDEHGNIFYYKDDQLHSENDLPAEEYVNGDKVWYQNGKLHRDNDLPAAVWTDGTKIWFQNDKRHRDNDQPAVERADGSKEWLQNSKLHRLAGPAWLSYGAIPLYYVDGKGMTKEQWKNHPEVKKYRLQQILNKLTA
jgi:hypothetical protein